MPVAEAPTEVDVSQTDVLTLAEAAAFLRTPEAAVLDLATKGAMPGQWIGGEWRFLKRAVVEWLRLGPHSFREFGLLPPPWLPDHPQWEALFRALEARLAASAPPAEPARGSAAAVLRHFGTFRDDGDLAAQLAATGAARKAAGG